MAEPMFVGFVLGKCEALLKAYGDEMQKDVYDSLVEMRDTAKHISRDYYDQEVTREPKREKNV